jgi:Tfp pilus assembly protein PilN
MMIILSTLVLPVLFVVMMFFLYRKFSAEIDRRADRELERIEYRRIERIKNIERIKKDKDAIIALKERIEKLENKSEGS